MNANMYFIVSAICLLIVLFILIIFLIRNTRFRSLYRNEMVTLSTIYKSVPDLVYSKDTSGRYTSCNSSFEAFVQKKENEIIGKTPFDIYPDKKNAQEFFDTDKWVIDNSVTSKSEKWLTFYDNSRRLLETISAPLIKDGKVIGLLGIARDITEHKKAEAAANDASKAKSNFLANMSHEIRTPMNAIVGMTELALRADNLNDAQKHIMTVKQASAHLLGIINDILDFSKIEKGKLEILPCEYSFANLINNVISIARMKLVDSDIRFVVNVDPNIPMMLIGDETRIRQVILNVLINAVKYTEKGFISFTVNKEIMNDDLVRLSIEVLDSGKGIKKENFDKLFDEYIQLDLGNKSVEGVGLGLAITKKILERMGGKIEFSSEFGKGSSFTLTIPQKIKSLVPLAYVDDPESKRILVYERRELYIHSIILAFEDLGIKYKIARDDEEFKNELNADYFNYVFISNMLFEKNKEIISNYENAVKTVVLTEFGETVLKKNYSSLAMPFYSISIANTLNGTSSNFGYSENNEHIIRFAAPKARVMIVDDINTNLKVAAGLMTPYQMSIDLCSSGKEAIEAIKQKQYDIVFMDHKMPEMDGIEATGIIRSINSNNSYYSNVPIIALTANALLGNKEMFLQNGFSDYLSKPINTIELDRILEKWIPNDKKKEQIWKRDESFSNMIIEFESKLRINDVDIKRGIHLSGGTIESYLDTLNIFYDDCLYKIEDMYTAIKNNNYKNYTISVHSIKSALMNIGASNVSLLARDLEEAGERGSVEYINYNNDNFVLSLKKLLNEIEKVLYSYKKIKRNDMVDMDVFMAELKKLKNALDVFDAGVVNRIIEDLKNKSNIDNISISVNNISDKILIGEYEEASVLVEKLYQEIDNDR